MEQIKSDPSIYPEIVLFSVIERVGKVVSFLLPKEVEQPRGGSEFIDLQLYDQDGYYAD